MSEQLPIVFWMAPWARMLSVFASIAVVMAGAFYSLNGTETWQQFGGAAVMVFGIAAFFDVQISRIVLDQDAISLISLARTRRYPRSDFESAKVDGGAVCLKRKDGKRLVLPGTGNNALSMRNVVDAWIKSAGR